MGFLSLDNDMIYKLGSVRILRLSVAWNLMLHGVYQTLTLWEHPPLTEVIGAVHMQQKEP